MVSDAVIRKAREIVNRGDVVPSRDPVNGMPTFIVNRKDTGTQALVFSYTDSSGRERFVSTSKQFRNTGRDDTYITAAKIYLGKTVRAN